MCQNNQVEGRETSKVWQSSFISPVVPILEHNVGNPAAVVFKYRLCLSQPEWDCWPRRLACAIRVGLIKLKLLSVTFWPSRGCFIVMYTHLDMKPTLFWLLDLNWQYRKHFHYTKEISKYTKENMQAERFGSNFSHIGPINLISWPVCHIFTDASLDTHINMTYDRHLSSLISDILEMPAMADDGHKSRWYGCIMKMLPVLSI